MNILVTGEIDNLVMKSFLYILLFFIILGCDRNVMVDPDPIVEDEEKSIIEYKGIEYQLTRENPVNFSIQGDTKVYDFGKAAFSYPEITLSGHVKDTLYISLGECIRSGRVDANPGLFRRYRRIAIPLQEGEHTYQPRLARDPYGSNEAPGFSMPEEVGEVTPFRYLEVEQSSKYSTCDVSRITVTCPFDDNASSFVSDNVALNEVWDFCKYSIKATSFTGYYIDGDRERRPYEADALINQLGHYGVDAYYPIARRTCEYLLEHPTWPTEWIFQTILIAWYDYLYTGSTDLISRHYELLKQHALFDLVDSGTKLITTKHGQPSSLLSSLGLKSEIDDIVDWPHVGDTGAPGEDDGFVYTDYNVVVNAYHYKAVETLSKIAYALGKEQEGKKFAIYAEKFKEIFNTSFFDMARGVYVDGIGVSHASLHANMFPLAFGLVPDAKKNSVADYVISRGVVCSVYGSQFLMEALYAAGRGDVAFDYLVSDGKRSWRNMMREGSTISMEAWGNEFKPDQDWNHAWGAAPANIIPFKVLGVQPVEAGFKVVEIKPQIGRLNNVSATVPTVKGQITIQISPTSLTFTVPSGSFARVSMPVPFPNYVVKVNGQQVQTEEKKGFIILNKLLSQTNSVDIVEKN